MKDGWETIIGLEIHAQLSTESKIFCGCSTRFGDEPNSNTCPVCLGLPGALPVLNRRAVELGARAALALALNINEQSIFARKNYFYPDLPKGYQISQYDQPFSERGELEIMTAERDEGGHPREWRPLKVRITRLHLEEDAGKNVHEGLPEVDRYSYIDLNRAGTPLAEIVTEPDFRSSWQAYDYVNYVRQALQWVGASEADMEKGNLRCEANVSVRRIGDEKFGTKVELKNLNSVRYMQRAIEFEIERQIELIESGGRVRQETRLWDERNSETRAMRSKEEAHDYRYFPEPDLPPLVVSKDFIEEVRASLPELPDTRRKRFVEEYGLSYADASQLTQNRALADYDEALRLRPNYSAALNNRVLAQRRRDEAQAALQARTARETQAGAQDAVPKPAPVAQTPQLANEKRVALVIGNSAYVRLPKLSNPRNDAQDLARELEALGFTVKLGLDASRAQMEDLLVDFAREARRADTAVVFFAGHGLQHNGVNYLEPVDAMLADETDLRRFIRLQGVLEDLQNARGVRILILDACRDNEAIQQLAANLPKSRSAAFTRGLAQE
nr:Asp-tRNA(Asn)/Glu-tRNA(Gln) amidotransferase subunit GatB [Acidobacteriota bacterium]